jgi:hypothetical protein
MSNQVRATTMGVHSRDARCVVVTLSHASASLNKEVIDMQPGTQIAYIPPHANGDITHEDVEFGFVTGEVFGKAAHFCRFWNKPYSGKLRTTRNSEQVPNQCIQVQKTVLDQDITKAMISLGYMYTKHGMASK